MYEIQTAKICFSEKIYNIHEIEEAKILQSENTV